MHEPQASERYSKPSGMARKKRHKSIFVACIFMEFVLYLQQILLLNDMAMKKKSILLRTVVLVVAMMCALGASAQEAYACYNESNKTLTFYYDNRRSSHLATTYDLNTGSNLPGWYNDGTYANVTWVVFDYSFTDARPTSTYFWFYSMENLESIRYLPYLNTSEVTNMAEMFAFCSNLTSLELNSFNTSKVTNMEGIFNGCVNLKSINVSNWNTSNVATMENMFRECSSLMDLDLSSFNTSNVTNMCSMFENNTSLTSLDLSNWNTSNVTDMRWMFLGCSNLTTIYAGNAWSTAAVTNSDSMFYNCTSLVGGQGTTYSRSHVDMAYAHIDGAPANPGYFTENDAPEAYVCYTPSNKTLTFYYDKLRGSRTCITYNLKESTGVIDGMGWYVDHTHSKVTQVVFDPSFADARPTTTSYWFYDLQNLESISGMSYLNTSEVTEMSGMFSNCRSLESIDLSHFNTSKVTTMRGMFDFCWVVTSLDLSSFNTASVTDMSWMFTVCYSLETIYVGDGWNTEAVTHSTEMFIDELRLVGGQGTTWNRMNPNDKTYARIDGGPSCPGYFTEKPAFIRGDVNGDSSVKISDVTTLIDLLLDGGTISNPAADCNQDGNISIGDVTALIDYLLNETW